MKPIKRTTKLNMKTAGVLVGALAFAVGCTKGSITSNSSSTASGSIVITDTYPTSSGSSWTPITSGGRVYVKGLSVTVEGTCSVGIEKIRANEGGPDFPEEATCGVDGRFAFRKTFTAVTGEGDKTLSFQAYDVADAAISGAVDTQDVRIDATTPSVPVVTTPAATPYNHVSSSNSLTIMGTVAADVDHLTGPGGVTITPVANAWTYNVTLTPGSSTNFTFYAWDLAGNQSAGFTQTVVWSPSIDMKMAGVFSGGQITDSGTSYKMEATHYIVEPLNNVHGGSSFNVLTGFNNIINQVRTD